MSPNYARTPRTTLNYHLFNEQKQRQEQLDGKRACKHAFHDVNVRIAVRISFTETAVLLVPWPFGLHTLRSLSLDCPQTC